MTLSTQPHEIFNKILLVAATTFSILDMVNVKDKLPHTLRVSPAALALRLREIGEIYFSVWFQIASKCCQS